MVKTAKMLVAVALAFMALVWVEEWAKGPLETVKVQHTVAEGECLWDIATYYMDKQDGVKDLRRLLWDIRQANKIENPGKLQPGQVILIPLQRKIQ